MNTKMILPIEYAKLWGCNKSYIYKLLRNDKGNKLPFVISIQKYSRFYTLEVPQTLTENDFIELKAARDFAILS